MVNQYGQHMLPKCMLDESQCGSWHNTIPIHRNTSNVPQHILRRDPRQWETIAFCNFQCLEFARWSSWWLDSFLSYCFDDIVLKFLSMYFTYVIYRIGTHSYL